MNFRSLSIAAALLAVVSLVSCSTSSNDASVSSSQEPPAGFQNRNADGNLLAEAFFELLAQTRIDSETLGATEQQALQGTVLVRPFLDSAFQLQRSAGERYTADTYVPAAIAEFEISNVVTTSPRDDIKVVRYTIRAPGAAYLDSAIVMSAELQPRLTVFRWDSTLDHWVLVSHANFNFPVAAICDQAPIRIAGEAAVVNPDDMVLGESLVEQWRAITMQESTDSVLHPEVQIQLANGQGFPPVDDSPIEWEPASAYTYENLSVTRNENLMVLSYNAVVSDLEVEGTEYRSTASPRLLTYLMNEEGEWSLIALANFVVPAAIPATVDCVAKGS